MNQTLTNITWLLTAMSVTTAALWLFGDDHSPWAIGAALMLFSVGAEIVIHFARRTSKGN